MKKQKIIEFYKGTFCTNKNTAIWNLDKTLTFYLL